MVILTTTLSDVLYQYYSRLGVCQLAREKVWRVHWVSIIWKPSPWWWAPSLLKNDLFNYWSSESLNGNKILAILRYAHLSWSWESDSQFFLKWLRSPYSWVTGALVIDVFLILFCPLKLLPPISLLLFDDEDKLCFCFLTAITEMISFGLGNDLTDLYGLPVSSRFYGVGPYEPFSKLSRDVLWRTSLCHMTSLCASQCVGVEYQLYWCSSFIKNLFKLELYYTRPHRSAFSRELLNKKMAVILVFFLKLSFSALASTMTMLVAWVSKYSYSLGEFLLFYFRIGDTSFCKLLKGGKNCHGGFPNKMSEQPYCRTLLATVAVIYRFENSQSREY